MEDGLGNWYRAFTEPDTGTGCDKVRADDRDKFIKSVKQDKEQRDKGTGNTSSTNEPKGE